MKLSTTTLILGVALAVVAGLFSSTIFGIVGTENKAQTTASASGYITGHVTAIVKDAEGNIKEYRQTDNRVVNQGENCVAKMLFSGSGGAATGTTVCVGTNTDGFRFIQIGNSSAGDASDWYKLGNPHNSTSFPAVPGSGLLIRPATSTVWTNSTGSGAGSTTTTVLSATFTNTAPNNSQTVSESGLFNSTADSSNALFARQFFTAITLNAGDSLTVAWTINVGGTTAALTP